MSTPNVVSVYSAGHRLQMLQAATDSHHDRASRLDNCTIRYYASARRRALYVSVSVSCRQVMKRTANGPQNDGCDFVYIRHVAGATDCDRMRKKNFLSFRSRSILAKTFSKLSPNVVIYNSV